MKTSSVAYATERVKTQTAPVYFVRFSHVKSYGDSTVFPFSVDFSSAIITAPSKTKYLYLGRIGGGPSQVFPEQGRASIGNFTIPMTDVVGEVLKYLSAPSLTLAVAMTATVPAAGGTITLNESPVGLPAVGTVEITTGGVIERVRYSAKSDAAKTLTVATAGRGADSTTAAAHALNDPLTNGEQIRPGQRCQLFVGYSPLNEADYMSFALMEVVDRRASQDNKGFLIEIADILRTVRRAVFLTARADAPVALDGNPVTLALQILTSTGNGTNGIYDVLAAANGLAIPQGLVDVAGLESLRDTEFAGQLYHFSIKAPTNAKDWLETEIWKTLNCYSVVLQDGKLSATRYKPPPAPASVTETLTNTDLISTEWVSGDRLIINRVIVEYDWDQTGASGAFNKRRIYTFDNSVAKFGPRQPLILDSRGLKSSETSVVTWIDDRAYMVGKRYADPPPVLKVRTFYRKHLWEVGDKIKLTYDKVPNLVTGQRGITNGVFEITDLRPSFGASGGLDLTLLFTGVQTIPSAPANGGTVTTPPPSQDTTPPAVPVGLTMSSSVAVMNDDGAVLAFLDISWAANSEADLNSYDVRFRRQGDTNWTSQNVPKAITALRSIDVLTNVVYEAQVQAIDNTGNASGFTASQTITTGRDTTPPGVPSGVVAISAVEGAILTWTPPTSRDLAAIEVWRSQTNSVNSATKAGETPGNSLFDSGLPARTAFFYWVRARDRSGNTSAFHTGDTAGLAVTTGGRIGYKLTLNTKIFTGTFVDTSMLAALQFDKISNDVDWLVRVGSDIQFGEVSQNGTVQTALGLKFTGDNAITSAWDQNNKHQCGLILSGKVRYARLSNTGTVEASPADLFTPPVNDAYARCALAAQGTTLFWAIGHDVGTPFTSAKIRFAKTDLSGVQTLAPTDITGTSSNAQSKDVRIVTDSDGNSHILFYKFPVSSFQSNAFQTNAFQASGANPMQYVKVDGTGAVLVGPSQLLAPPPGANDVAPAAMVIDGTDTIHVIGYSFIGTGMMFSYGRISKAGAVIVPLTLFYSTPADITWGFGTRDPALNQIYFGWANTSGITQLRLDPVDPTGEATDVTFQKASL